MNIWCWYFAPVPRSLS